jgi:hypothetical protein
MNKLLQKLFLEGVKELSLAVRIYSLSLATSAMKKKSVTCSVELD